MLRKMVVDNLGGCCETYLGGPAWRRLLAASLLAAGGAAQADLTWSTKQLLPSFPAPKPVQDLITLRETPLHWEAEGPTPTSFLNVANSLGSDHVVIRPDTAFQLLREANGLPWW